MENHTVKNICKNDRASQDIKEMSMMRWFFKWQRRFRRNIAQGVSSWKHLPGKQNHYNQATIVCTWWGSKFYGFSLHNTLSHQNFVYSSTKLFPKRKSRSVIFGPGSHCLGMFSIVCDGWPHVHSPDGVRPHLWKFLPVLPTLVIARSKVFPFEGSSLRQLLCWVLESVLGWGLVQFKPSFQPVDWCRLGPDSHFSESSSIIWGVVLVGCVHIYGVYRLFLVNIFWVLPCNPSVYLGVLSLQVCTMREVLFAVGIRQAWLNSILTFRAWQDFSHTTAHNWAVEYEGSGLSSAGLKGPLLRFCCQVLSRGCFV